MNEVGSFGLPRLCQCSEHSELWAICYLFVMRGLSPSDKNGFGLRCVLCVFSSCGGGSGSCWRVVGGWPKFLAGRAIFGGRVYLYENLIMNREDKGKRYKMIALN